MLVFHLELLEEHGCVLGQGHLLHHVTLLLLVAYSLSSKEWLDGTAATCVILGTLGDTVRFLSLLMLVFLLVERLGCLLSAVEWRPTAIILTSCTILNKRGLMEDSFAGVGTSDVL